MAKRESSSQVAATENNRGVNLARTEASSELLRELVAHLRQNRTQLREEWVSRIAEARLLTAMTKEEIFAEATGSSRDRNLRSTASLRAKSLGTHHSSRR